MSALETHHIAAAADMNAPARTLYAILADYHVGHPRILPRPPFLSMRVQAGGIGAGTRIEVTMRILGGLRRLGTHIVTSFIVEPRAGDRGAAAGV